MTTGHGNRSSAFWLCTRTKQSRFFLHKYFAFLQNPSDVLTAQYEPLALKNISSLPLHVMLSLQEPFSLCDADQEVLPVPEQVEDLPRASQHGLGWVFLSCRYTRV